MTMEKRHLCDLCFKAESTIYCEPDEAFLCWGCDARVHEANFLTARHVRQLLCCKCGAFTGKCVSGVGLRQIHKLCPDCSVGEDSGDSSSESSACVSSDESCVDFGSCKTRFDDRKKAHTPGSSSSEHSGMDFIIPDEATPEMKRKNERDRMRTTMGVEVEEKAEGILGKWCRELGLKGNSRVVSLAAQALRVLLNGSRVLPFRVSLAASFWYGLRASGDLSMSTRRNLRRVEELSRVPAKLFVVVEARLARAMMLRRRRRRRQTEEEGWDESCTSSNA